MIEEKPQNLEEAFAALTQEVVELRTQKLTMQRHIASVSPKKTGPKKTGRARADGCSYSHASTVVPGGVRCGKKTRARTGGKWLCPLHAALDRGESPPRDIDKGAGGKTRARPKEPHVATELEGLRGPF